MLTRAEAEAWLVASRRAVRRLARDGWPRAAAEDAAAETVARSLHRPPGAIAWWWLYRRARQFLLQRSRGDQRDYRGPRGAGLAPIASPALHHPDGPQDPDDWIAEVAAAGGASSPAVLTLLRGERSTAAEDVALLLEVAGLSGEEIAQALGTTRYSVSWWARGKGQPLPAMRRRLAALADDYRRQLAADLGLEPATPPPAPPPLPAKRPRPEPHTEAARLLARAVEAGWSLRRVAARLGAGHVTVQRWARGEAQPGPERLERLRDLAGAPPA